MKRHNEGEGGPRLNEIVVVRRITHHGIWRKEVNVDLSRNLDADSPALNDVSVQKLAEELRKIGKNPLGHQGRPYRKPCNR